MEIQWESPKENALVETQKVARGSLERARRVEDQMRPQRALCTPLGCAGSTANVLVIWKLSLSVARRFVTGDPVLHNKLGDVLK